MEYISHAHISLRLPNNITFHCFPFQFARVSRAYIRPNIISRKKKKLIEKRIPERKTFRTHHRERKTKSHSKKRIIHHSAAARRQVGCIPPFNPLPRLSLSLYPALHIYNSPQEPAFRIFIGGGGPMYILARS